MNKTITINQAIEIATKCAVSAINNYANKNAQPTATAIQNSLNPYIDNVPSIDSDDLKQTAILSVLEILHDNKNITVEEIKATAFKAVNKALYNARKDVKKSVYVADYEKTDSDGNAIIEIVDRDAKTRAMLFDNALSYNDKLNALINELTYRQKTVLYLLYRGFNPNRIAKRLGVDDMAVFKHINAIRKKADLLFSESEKQEIINNVCSVYTVTQYQTPNVNDNKTKTIEFPCDSSIDMQYVNDNVIDNNNGQWRDNVSYSDILTTYRMLFDGVTITPIKKQPYKPNRGWDDYVSKPSIIPPLKRSHDYYTRLQRLYKYRMYKQMFNELQ